MRLLNCASGATWVSIHHGGGVGIGYSQHAGMVIVCDGTATRPRLERVLWNDPPPASCAMRMPVTRMRWRCPRRRGGGFTFEVQQLFEK